MTDLATPIALGWKVVIRPKEGKQFSAGGIDMSAAAEAEAHLSYIGQVLVLGEAAFTARTKSGIDMSQWKVRPQVGDWVIHTPYAGMRIRRSGAPKSERWVVLMNDTDIQCIIDDPDDFYSWVDMG